MGLTLLFTLAEVIERLKGWSSSPFRLIIFQLAIGKQVIRIFGIESTYDWHINPEVFAIGDMQ
jgi:hypothetical protein